MFILIAFAALAAVGLVSTAVALRTDGHRRIPTDRTRLPTDDRRSVARRATETAASPPDRGAHRAATRPGLTDPRAL